MTKGKIILIQKDLKKENILSKYRRITCLPMMWKVLTKYIKKKLYYLLKSPDYFRKSRKGVAKE